MYTYEPDCETEDTDYNIYDPEGTVICWVPTKDQAQALISHLNRE